MATSDANTTITRPALKTPRTAAAAGIIFSVLLSVSLVLIRIAIPSSLRAAEGWIADPWRRNAVLIGLYLIPFAGIAFLWFIGVVRDRIGPREDRFFATVFLGSGLLFVAMMFVSAAISAGLATAFAHGPPASPAVEIWRLGHEMTTTLVNVYAMRMASVFMTMTATISLRMALLPRWIVYLGFGGALILLFSAGALAWVELLFPIWIFIVSVYLLCASLRSGSDGADAGQ
jgi:hypothetical protein